MLSFSTDGLSAGTIEDTVIDRLPENVFGRDEWASNATQHLVRHLLEAVSSGQSNGFARAIRSIAHSPSPQNVRAIANAVCDSADTHALISLTESEPLREKVAFLRIVANQTLDLALEEVPHESSTAATLTACNTLLHLGSVSRPQLVKHLEAVAALTVRIARDLGLSDDVVERARLAGLLHDVGLLSSTADEASTEHDTEHVAVGERYLSGIEPLAYIAPIVRAHHEYFDGTGELDGLRGAEIPIEARIITVADAFERDANRTGRGNPVAATISGLWTSSGTRYDPEVVASITRIFRQPRLTQRAASGSS